MANDLKLNNEYKVIFKRLLFKKRFSFFPVPCEYRNKFRGNEVCEIAKRFQIYKIEDIKLKDLQYIYFKCSRYIQVFNVVIYTFAEEDGQLSRAIEILDIAVHSKYRKCGIGKQLIQLLEKIATENKIKYIVGELQDDKKDEPLHERKSFFENNGFETWYDERAKFSGWVARRSL